MIYVVCISDSAYVTVNEMLYVHMYDVLIMRPPALLQAAGPKEKVMFADRVKHATLAGKKSFFGKLFGAKDSPTTEPRFILISDKVLASSSLFLSPPSPVLSRS